MTDAELAALEARMITQYPPGSRSSMSMGRKRTAALTPGRMVTAARMMRVWMMRQQVTTRRALGGKRATAALALSMAARATTRSWP
jgi:hypothetical protein